MIYHLDVFISLVGTLLSIAFFTLMERKVMGLAHYRKGPNKVMVLGLTQPIADAVKLMMKENQKMFSSKMFMMMMGPFISMGLMLVCWVWFNYMFQVESTYMKILILFATMSLMCYGLLFMSWGSNSKYALLGGQRGVAQVLSYEVCLFLFILFNLFVANSFSIYHIEMNQQGIWMCLMAIPFFLVWVTLCMAESNRTPFDMAEGESEIVSGFNIEYSSGLFALIFISEYGMIIFLSYLTAFLFLGSSSILKVFLVCFLFVWVRCAFPRVRYDQLMFFSWKMALPMSLMALLMALIF